MYPFFNGSPGTGNYNRYMPQAYPGRLSGFGSAKVLPHVNNVAETEVWTLTPPASPTAAAKYSATINGIKVEVTADADPTALEVGTALYNALRLEPQLYGAIDPALNTSTGVITLNVMGYAQMLTVTTSAGVTAAKTVAATYGNVIPFARFVGRKSTYYRDSSDGTSQASLISDNSSFTLLGVTMASYATERIVPGNVPNTQATEGYPFGYVMNVISDTGTCRGVWVECVDADLNFDDTLYIATSAGNEGKLTRTSTSNVALGTKGKLAIAATQTFGNRSIALLELHL